MATIMEEISHLVELAAKITLIVYFFPLNINSILTILSEPSLLNIFSIPLSFIVFYAHLLVTKKRYFVNSIRSLFSAFYCLNLSYSLVVLSLSVINPTFREVVSEINFYLSYIGQTTLKISMSFMFILILDLFLLIIKKIENIILSISLVVVMYFLYASGSHLLLESSYADKIGLFLIGPIYLFILKILFTKDPISKPTYRLQT